MRIEGTWCHLEMEENCTVEQFLEKWHLSVKKMNRMIQEKKAFLDGKHFTVKDSLKDRRLSLNLFEEEEIDFVCDEIAPEILYEDEFVLVVNKPSGVIIHEDDKKKHGTLNNQVAKYYEMTHQKHAVRPVHRLDAETCGCVLYCKSSWVQPYFDAAIEKKEIHRTYLAFVKGLASFDDITVNRSIGKDRHVNGKMRLSKTGKHAVTHIRTLKRIPKLRISILECVLDTGRTHQIRLHAASLQLPILNDALYGVKEKGLVSMGLCAKKLEWKTPFTNQMKCAEASLPNDLKNLLRK